MSRRRVIKKRAILPDTRHNSLTVAKFINHIMCDGKKSIAVDIVYSSIELAASRAKIAAGEVLDKVLLKVGPMVEVRSRRVGGATYQIPVEVKADRRVALAMRWLIAAATKRSEKGMIPKLAAEMLDALDGRGEAVKKRVDTQKMADANQAFAHFA